MRSAIPEMVKASIRDSLEILEGKVLTQPALLRSSESGDTTWAVDVEISGFLAPIENRILKNVPVAMPATHLHYASRGLPVTLKRTRGSATPFEIVGPAKTNPGQRWNNGVDVTTGTILSSTDYTTSIEPLSYEDFDTDYGTIPYGAHALYQGGVFIRYV